MTISRHFRPPQRKAAEFRNGRTPQGDLEFLAGCGIQSGTDAACTALAVRRVVARLGQLEPEWIRWYDRWPDDLGELTFWDSLDFLEVTLRLEDELNRKIRNGELFGPELWQGRRSFAIADLVNRVMHLFPGAERVHDDSPKE